MKHRILILLLLCMYLPSLFALESLDIFVHNIHHDGKLRVYIYDNARYFASKKGIIYKKELMVSGRKDVSIFCSEIGADVIAVMVFQDLNNNKLLDTNWLSQPIEPYGFSNNVTSIAGAPSFEKASFALKPCKSIHIRLINP